MEQSSGRTPDPRTVRPNGPLIKELRKKRFNTVEDFLEALGGANSEVSLRTLGKIERGNGAVFPSTVRVIANFFEVEFESLLVGHSEAPSLVCAKIAVGGTFQLPPLLPDFTGREIEVRKISKQLCHGGRVGISALRGMGGVGKTMIAIQVAHSVKDQFPDAQLFFDLKGVEERPVTAIEVMTQFICDLQGEAVDLPKTESELLPKYRSALAGKRALMVLDNVRDEPQIRNLIAGDRTAFIITSRNALALDGVTSFRIDVLSSQKSQRLLRSIVGKKGTAAELRRLAELCDFLPLALRVAGDFLRLKPDWTAQKYTLALEKERLRWLKIGDAEEKDVAYVLKLSAAQLVRDNPQLALQWHYLADWPGDFTLDAVAAAWDMDSKVDEVLHCLSELVSRSVLLFNEQTARYRQHDLMKPIAAGLFA